MSSTPKPPPAPPIETDEAVQVDTSAVESDKPSVAIIKSGYLEKIKGGSLTTRWVKRYYVLTEDSLCRFDRQEGDVFMGVQKARYLLIDILSIALNETSDSMFHISMKGGHVSKLKAKSKAEATKWKGAIQSAVYRAQRQAKHNTPRVKKRQRRTISGDFQGLVFGHSAQVVASPFRLTVQLSDGQKSKGNSLVPSEEMCVGCVEHDNVFVVETDEGGIGRIPASRFEGIEKKDELMRIVYEEDEGDSLMKSLKEENSGTLNEDIYGRLLSCKLRFRWTNLTDGSKGARRRGYMKIAIPTLAMTICSVILAQEDVQFHGEYILWGTALACACAFVFVSDAIRDITLPEEQPVRVCYVSLVDDDGDLARRNAKKKKDLPAMFDAQSLLESISLDMNDEFNHADIPLNQETPQRWLNAEKDDPQLARRRWKFTEKWRADQGVDRILEIPHVNYEKIKPVFQNYYYSVDREGRCPLYIESPALLDIQNLQKAGLTIDDFIFHYIWITEYIWTEYMKGNEESRTLLLMDLEDVSMSTVRGKSMEIIKKMMKIFGTHYPERTEKAFICNGPWWFNSVYTVVKVIMNKNTVAKFNVFSSNKSKSLADALKEYVDEDKIPIKYGGTSAGSMLDAPVEKQMRAFAHAVVKKCGLQMAPCEWTPPNYVGYSEESLKSP